MISKESIIELKNGDLLCASGEDIEYLYVIVKGKITAYANYGTLQLTPGAIPCLADSCYGISLFNYVAAEDTIVQKFPYSGHSDLGKILDAYPNDFGKFVIIQQKLTVELIKIYLTLLIKCKKNDTSFIPDSRVEKNALDKHNALISIPSEVSDKYYLASKIVAACHLADSAAFSSLLNDVTLQMADILNMDLNYVPKAPEPELQIQPISSVLEASYYNDEDISKSLLNSFEKIMTYGNLESDDKSYFHILIKKFKQMPDKLSLEEDARKLRKEINDGFYALYRKVFLHAVNDDFIPSEVMMFLNFGYIDEELVGMDHAVQLYKLVQNIEETCNNSHVYTLYYWLKHVYWGEKEPCKTNLEQTFEEYMKEQSRTGRLSKPLQDVINDNEEKLNFEINNMFMQTHRMAYGHVSSFVPVLVSENIFKGLEHTFLTAEAVMQTINYVRSLDFSVFYRSTVYSSEEFGITKEYTYKEILPDIILLPCIGSMGVMWQEIEGRQRNSSARFMLPVFCNESFDTTIISVLGRFRWELCKRIQGAYWNNLTEKSLTSEYVDYLQFYRKNRDLSDPTKEKIKSSLLKARNNFAFVFAKDYEQWILYESKGIGKLNKSSRNIMAKYCPFTHQKRTELKGNPLFADSLSNYERITNIQKKRIDTIIAMLTNKNVPIPREIRETKAYYSR